MKNNSQGILEYAVVLGVVIVALVAMSLYFRRGIQAVIKVAADEAGSQKDAEEIDPLKGVKTSSSINRITQGSQKISVRVGDERIVEPDITSTSSGSSESVSIQEK